MRVILCVLIPLVVSKHFSVFRLSAPSDESIAFLHRLAMEDRLDFWKEPRRPDQEVHLMLDEERAGQLLPLLDEHNITHSVMIPDVQSAIEKQQRGHHHSWRRMKDYQDARVQFNIAEYHSFADVINYMNALAVSYPERVSVQPIGTTHEGRQIPLIKITNKRISGPKRAIWLDGGIHAREWISPSTILYFIHQLINGYDTDPLIRRFVDQIDWYLVPLLNPDGYEYSRSSTDPEIRLWRKNRSPAKCTQTSTGLFSAPRTQCCQGVDLNRNFDWFFGQVGSSTDPCSEIYQILMYPFGHQIRTYSNDLDELRSTALSAAQALQNLYGTTYKVGTGADTLYPASGGSEDWAKGKAGVKFSYLFELRPEEQVWDGFLLPENQILPTARETWEAVKVLATQTLSVPLNGVARTPECRDLDALCHSWAAGGACSSWPEMLERCPLSCRLCQ